MAKLAALNIKGVIEGYPVWDKGSIDPFLGDNPPKAIPSIVNKSVLKILNHGDHEFLYTCVFNNGFSRSYMDGIS